MNTNLAHDIVGLVTDENDRFYFVQKDAQPATVQPTTVQATTAPVTTQPSNDNNNDTPYMIGDVNLDGHVDPFGDRG